jgi:NTP pyrophosphatase (non-canonical NTP hydrolase)
MDLKSMQKMQTDFSESRGWYFHKAVDQKELIEKMEYMAVALAGEVGEYANLVKKILRQKELLNNEMKDRIKEEITDIFIYCLLTSSLLGMDLEKEALKKIEKNKQRFAAKS